MGGSGLHRSVRQGADRRRRGYAGRSGRHDQGNQGYHVRDLQAGHRRRVVAAHGPAQGARTAGHDDVLEPVDRLAVGRQARREPSDERESPRAADRQERALRVRQGRQAVLEDEAVPTARRYLRGDHRPLLQGCLADRLRRGEPRLGRRVRRLPRPDRGSAVPPPV